MSVVNGREGRKMRFTYDVKMAYVRGKKVEVQIINCAGIPCTGVEVYDDVPWCFAIDPSYIIVSCELMEGAALSVVSHLNPQNGESTIPLQDSPNVILKL